MTDAAAAQARRGQCSQKTMTAAYLDGELERAAADDFERHAAACGVCSGSLLEQRRLLCLLDTAFDETFTKGVALPKGFTQQVKARAQNDMRGVRAPLERRRALKICVALAAAAFALLGVAAFDAVIKPVLGAARAAGGTLGMAGHAAADAGAGAGVVLRAIGDRLAAASEPLAILQWVAFACAVLLLLRLISGYHRAGASN